MKTRKILLSTIIAVCLLSCSDFLDPYPNGDRSEEDLWEYQDMVQGLIGQSYDYMSRNYDNNEGAYFDCMSDNAVRTSTTDPLRQLAVGALTTGQDPFRTYWDRDYKAIRLLNMFLEDRKGYNTRFLIVPHLDTLVRNRLLGEAFALRAYFQWDLLQKFGGRGMDGQMLGFPIINQPQVAILGVGSVVKRPVVVQDPDLGEVIAIRSMVYLALTYDHRIVDGADAARFLTTVRERLEAGQFEGELGLA